MAERTVLGVDFSGAETSNATWVAYASLGDDGVLNVQSCESMGYHRQDAHEQLERRIWKLPYDAVAAMDFPFGVPQEFLTDEFAPNATMMPHVWEAVPAQDELPKFIKDMRPRLRNGDLKKFSKSKRLYDSRHYPKAKSPLDIGPELFPMTFYGMGMLHRLWFSDGSHFRVPPLEEQGRLGPVLLEVFPGAVLSAFGLLPKYQGYKSKKHPSRAQYLRFKIVTELEAGLIFPGFNISKVRDICIKVDHCLDSVVATIAAAGWAKDKTLFHRPEDHQDPVILATARLEGCIYSPIPNK